MIHPKAEYVIGIDFETYSAAPLPTVGLARYVNDPTFEPTLCGVATGSGTVVLEPRYSEDRKTLQDMICPPEYIITAQNAGFENAVLNWLGIEVPLRDTAVVAAVAGASRHLRGAAEQLLGLSKLDEDGSLLRLFAMPQKDQEDLEFDRSLIEKHPEKWKLFREYCARDAELSRGIYLNWWGDSRLHLKEMRYDEITRRMNDVGWPVDVPLVHEMRERYLANLDRIQDEFADQVDKDLNLASTPQLKKWCADRGVRASSFDKEHVASLLTKLYARAKVMALTAGQAEVVRMLETKKALGGSSLKKLETILDTQFEGRVYDQYVHAGAAQSLRTSGRSIQMQNLPRLPAVPRDMSTVKDPSAVWTNDDLGENLRQVFRAEHPQGLLIVADFASVESRALAFLADEAWKVHAYAKGEDVYKRQAMKIYNLQHIDDVTPDERRTGKVGELSCGYGAGPVAVKDFAAKMHVEMSEAEAKSLVMDWRAANPATVKLWGSLHDAIVKVVEAGGSRVVFLPGPASLHLTFAESDTPRSLFDQDPDAKTVRMSLHRSNGELLLTRFFHGCYMRGSNVGYYKPSTLKTGKPWKRTFTNPKTKRNQRYELYGGKLAGILTQSLCREIFFDCLSELDGRLRRVDNAKIVGQFHDEVVVEWSPGDIRADETIAKIHAAMGRSRMLPDLPMSVEVKYDRRYVK